MRRRRGLSRGRRIGRRGIITVLAAQDWPIVVIVRPGWVPAGGGSIGGGLQTAIAREVPGFLRGGSLTGISRAIPFDLDRGQITFVIFARIDADAVARLKPADIGDIAVLVRDGLGRDPEPDDPMVIGFHDELVADDPANHAIGSRRGGTIGPPALLRLLLLLLLRVAPARVRTSARITAAWVLPRKRELRQRRRCPKHQA